MILGPQGSLGLPGDFPNFSSELLNYNSDFESPEARGMYKSTSKGFPGKFQGCTKLKPRKPKENIVKQMRRAGRPRIKSAKTTSKLENPEAKGQEHKHTP